MRLRKMFACLFAFGLSPALLPLGCGGPSENYTVVQGPASESAEAIAWSIPDTVVEQMRACAREHARELKTYSHEAKLDLMVTEDGEVQNVRLRSSTLHHDALESCLVKAVAAVSVPSSALTLRSSGPISGGESSPESRGPLGIAQVLGGAIAAGPVILIAAGVTIAVYAAAVATEEAIEAIRRTRKLENMCDALVVECLADKRQPPGSEFGTEKDCGACGRLCKNYGYWPLDKCPRTN